MTLSAVVHLCSLAGYQEGLLWLVHAWQVDIHASDSLRLHATLHGLVRLHQKENCCVCVVLQQRVGFISSGTLQLERDSLGAVQRWLGRI